MLVYLVVALAAIVVLVAGCVLGAFFLQWLASINLFFTTVREGTAKAIMRGQSFDHFVMSFAGYHLNDPRKTGSVGCYEPWLKDKNGDIVTDCGENVRLPDWEVVFHGEGNRKGFASSSDSGKCYDDRSWLLKKLGIYWIGWPWMKSVYVYGFEWNETYTDSDGKEKILPRKEATDIIYVSDFTYAIVTKGAETKDLLPVDVLTLVTVAIRNPYRALFSGEDWMRRITAAINRHARNYMGLKDYRELVSLEKDKWPDFSQPVIALSDELIDDIGKPLPHGLKGRYGAEIRTADLQTIDLTGDAEKETQQAAAKVFTAEQTAKATEIEGKAKAKVIEMIGEKEAASLDKRLEVIKKHGAAGELLAQLDAIQESSKGSGNTIIWANNPFVSAAAKILGGDK